MLSRKCTAVMLFVLLLAAFSMIFSTPVLSQQQRPGTHGQTIVNEKYAGNTRTIAFVNKCKQDIWWGVVTNDKGKDCGSGFFGLPGNGGGYIKAGGSQSVTVNLEKVCGNAYKWSGNIYPRTGCKFDSNGVGQCETGGCGNKLHCEKGVGGVPPKTLTEFTFWSNYHDTYDVSNVDGANVPMQIKPTGIIPQMQRPTGDKYWCTVSKCAFDFTKEANPKDESACLNDLKFRNGKGVLVGCKSACTAFDAGHADRMANSKYCCTGSYFGPEKRNNYGNCPPTEYSKFFKASNRCPDSYSWPQDDNNSTFACIASGYEITFCP